jgi:hypothetical protein
MALGRVFNITLAFGGRQDEIKRLRLLVHAKSHKGFFEGEDRLTLILSFHGEEHVHIQVLFLLGLSRALLLHRMEAPLLEH